MCLELKNIGFDHSQKRKVYKVVGRSHRPINSKYALYSLFFTQYWKLGVNVSTRVKTKIRQSEIEYNFVGEGFHFFTSLKSAKRYACQYHHVILECEVNPEDYVAQGKWDRYNSVIYRKCNVVKVLKRRNNVPNN